jgi:hypothetical protein
MTKYRDARGYLDPGSLMAGLLGHKSMAEMAIEAGVTRERIRQVMLKFGVRGRSFMTTRAQQRRIDNDLHPTAKQWIDWLRERGFTEFDVPKNNSSYRGTATRTVHVLGHGVVQVHQTSKTSRMGSSVPYYRTAARRRDVLHVMWTPEYGWVARSPYYTQRIWQFPQLARSFWNPSSIKLEPFSKAGLIDLLAAVQGR